MDANDCQIFRQIFATSVMIRGKIAVDVSIISLFLHVSIVLHWTIL